MENFTYYNPVKILFGRDQIKSISSEIPNGAKILMLYGGGSIKKNGVYDQVKAALKNFDVYEFSGVEPNPTYETLMNAVSFAKKNGVNFILAVGGGSVIDGAKFIAAAYYFEGSEPWDILSSGAEVKKALPMGVVLTLPATGSEMNGSSVVSRTSTKEKRYFISPLVLPKFSVLDPVVTFSLPLRQVGNGVVDAFTHTMEQYLTYPANAPLQDRFAESILKTLIEEGVKTYQNPDNYDARANLMWCATQALNGLIACGVPQDWTTHMIGHEITALHNLDHAQTLAIILPAVLKIKQKNKQEKLLQYAERVWGITSGSSEAKMQSAIQKTRDFFESVGVPTKLSSYNLKYSDVSAIPERLNKQGMNLLGERQDTNSEVVIEILKEAL